MLHLTCSGLPPFAALASQQSMLLLCTCQHNLQAACIIQDMSFEMVQGLLESMQDPEGLTTGTAHGYVAGQIYYDAIMVSMTPAKSVSCSPLKAALTGAAAVRADA